MPRLSLRVELKVDLNADAAPVPGVEPAPGNWLPSRCHNGPPFGTASRRDSYSNEVHMTMMTTTTTHAASSSCRCCWHCCCSRIGPGTTVPAPDGSSSCCSAWVATPPTSATKTTASTASSALEWCSRRRPASAPAPASGSVHNRSAAPPGQRMQHVT